MEFAWLNIIYSSCKSPKTAIESWTNIKKSTKSNSVLSRSMVKAIHWNEY